jgi:hypothetical protein
VVLMLPVAAAVYLLVRPDNRGLALLALAVGSIGMIIVQYCRPCLSWEW